MILDAAKNLILVKVKNGEIAIVVPITCLIITNTITGL